MILICRELAGNQTSCTVEELQSAVRVLKIDVLQKDTDTTKKIHKISDHTIHRYRLQWA